MIGRSYLVMVRRAPSPREDDDVTLVVAAFLVDILPNLLAHH